MKKHYLIYLMLCISTSVSASISTHLKGSSIEISNNSTLKVITFVKPDVVRIQFSPDTRLYDNNTGICIYNKTKQDTKVKQIDKTTFSSKDIILKINSNTGAIQVFDNNSKLIFSELLENPQTYKKVYSEKVTFDESTRRVEHTANGDVEKIDISRRDTIGSSFQFNINLLFQPQEAIYGLGSHIEDYMNLRGKKMYLCQHNLKAMVPVINSTAGYGLLFDAGCSMIYDDTTGSYASVELEAAKEIDYYIMTAPTMDGVVSHYHELTGSSPMMPLYLFGYNQSKERYVSSDDLTSTLREFRKRQIPIDVIVQDWNYWPNGQWGYMKMNKEFYPDKKALADSIHNMHAKLMISIWPNAQGCPQFEDFKSKGWIFDGTTIYDAFNPEARKLYWDYANNEFFKNGFDAWWCDSSEPLDDDWTWNLPKDYGYNSHKERWQKSTRILSDCLGPERSQLFSLYHAMGIYENQRKTTDSKRVVNLTRSSYAGQQRYATITWNGDTSASWDKFASMIPAGLNFMATGCPYWSVDIGAFLTTSDNRWFFKGEYPRGNKDPEYCELYTRMLQYATFLPVMRSHGTSTPREPWQFGKPGEPFYDAIIEHINLRYKMLPYIYSISAKNHQDGYTITRALAFDFAKDAKALDIKDEFMFGPALLIAPVTKPILKYDERPTRQVYLPENKAGWYDFWNGDKYEGGKQIDADAPINHIPVFVKAGSIIPFGPVQQYSNEKPDAPYDIHIYPGADADFTIYEDAGDGYDYERGASCTYTLHWDDNAKTLSISDRKGSFPQMIKKRTLRIFLPDKDAASITYQGKAQKWSSQM